MLVPQIEQVLLTIVFSVLEYLQQIFIRPKKPVKTKREIESETALELQSFTDQCAVFYYG